MPIIPFRFLPAAWGLKGRPRAEAEANYYLEGQELETRLAEIKFEDEPQALKEKLLELDLKYKKIDEYDYDKKLLEIRDELNTKTQAGLDFHHDKISHYDHDKIVAEYDHPDDPKAYQLALLEVELNHGKMTQFEYEKACATIREEPWHRIVNENIDLSEGGILEGAFEFDWNDYFVDYLRLHGYVGLNDEDVVNQWFMDICRSQAMPHNVFPFPGNEDAS